MTVYCLSQGSALAQSPAWGQLGAPGQVGGKPRPITVQYSGHVICPDQLEDSIESWRVTIAERAESGERHCIYKTVNSFSPCISHISSNNPIHAEKSVCARFFHHSPMISRKDKAESVD